MKKYFLTILLTIIVLSFEAFSACPTPLSWDYPQYPYIGENTESVPLSINPLCILHYKYCYRTTPGYYDFAVTEVSLEGDCNQFTNVDTLVKYAARDIVANKNPWFAVIPACPEISAKFWRQSTAACFTEFWWDVQTLRWISVSCDSDGQERWCWTYYQYCWYWENGNKYLRETIVNRNMGGPSCPTITTYGKQCNQRCQ